MDHPRRAFRPIGLLLFVVGCNAIGGIEDGDDDVGTGIGGTPATPTAGASGGGGDGGTGLVSAGGSSGMGGGPEGGGGTTNVPEGGVGPVAPCGADGQACCSEGAACQGRLSCSSSEVCVLCGSFAGLVAPAPYTALSVAGVSGDGRVVVGSLAVGAVNRAFRWWATTGTFDLYPDDAATVDSYASTVSADGGVVIGNAEFADDPNTRRPFRWTSSGVEYLPLPPGGVLPASARDVSSDGSVVVGSSQTEAGDSLAWHWQAAGSEDLGVLLGNGGSAYRVSADGRVIVGDTQGGGNNRGFRFTWDPTLMPPANGTFDNLGVLTGDATSFARGVSANGNVVVGTSALGSRNTAVRWDYPSATPTGLAPLSAGGTSQAFDVSEDGRVAIGIAQSATNVAVLWDATGVHSIQQSLTDLRVTVPAGWSLDAAIDISADGRVIVGDGTNPALAPEAWIAVLSEGCPSP
jgi:probable HAF family extracellular repeat protein